MLEPNLQVTAYTTIIELSMNSVYDFYVTSENSAGTSLDSNIVSVRVASLPSQPQNVNTLLNGEFVDVSWDVPSDGGSAITNYIIKVRGSDGVTYHQETTGCEGSDASTIAFGLCSIPKINLLLSPFDLAWGDEIHATVSAVTAVGESQESAVGTVSYLLRLPDTPLNFRNVPETTLST